MTCKSDGARARKGLEDNIKVVLREVGCKDGK
jgi:hypothetical protein